MCATDVIDDAARDVEWRRDRSDVRNLERLLESFLLLRFLPLTETISKVSALKSYRQTRSVLSSTGVISFVKMLFAIW